MLLPQNDSCSCLISGGSVLTTLLKSEIVTKDSISVVVRGEEKAKTLEKLGVKTVLFNSLDDSELLRRIASKHDSTYLPVVFANCH